MTGTGSPGKAGRLPVHVRAMRRLSARGLPGPVCEVAVQHRIAVPAGDGVPLLTDHYIPLADGPFPALLIRTPYGRGFPWDYVYGAQFAAQGFHVLIQSCRGTGGSGGTFDPYRHERADGQATVAWLRQQDWFSGALGTIGTSYLGYTAWALSAGSPPELRAIVADGSVDPHAFMYPGGAFALQNVLVGAVGTLFAHRGPAIAARAMLRLRRHQRRVAAALPLIDAYPAALGGRSELFERLLTNPDPASPYWNGVDLTAATAELAIPVSLVTGWDDVQLDQTLGQYRRLREAGADVRLIVGPWNHTSIFDKGYPVVFPRALEEFRTRLSGQPGCPAGQPVRVHVGGSGQWRDLPDWPPPQARSHALVPGPRRLAWRPATRAGGIVIVPLRPRRSDPLRGRAGPVGHRGQRGQCPAGSTPRRPHVHQRPAHRRPGNPRPGQRPAADPRQQPVPRRVRPAVRRRPATDAHSTSATA